MGSIPTVQEYDIRSEYDMLPWHIHARTVA